MPLSITVPNDHFFSEETKVMVRSNKEYLLTQGTVVDIHDHSIVAAHRYNFYRILSMHGIPSHMFWITAFLNDIENPDQYVYGLKQFFRIDVTVIETMLARSRTNQGV